MFSDESEVDHVTTVEHLQKKEMRHLRTVLKGNGYPTNPR